MDIAPLDGASVLNREGRGEGVPAAGRLSELSPPDGDVERIPDRRWRYRFAKRAIDVAVASLLLAASGPMILSLALLVRIVSPGPAFYHQFREGLGGRKFKMWKIRTMHVDADARLHQLLAHDGNARLEWERFIKLRRDPRVIPLLGVFLRRSSLDELPQLVNVLRGDMSLVGPRPFPDYHLERFDPEFRARRREVMPGITGLWQVTARSQGDLSVQRSCDLAYIENRSLKFDLKILAQTIAAILRGDGAY